MGFCMSAVVRQFLSPPDRLRRDEAERVKAALVGARAFVRPEVQFCVDRVVVEVDRQTASFKKELFLMVYREFSLVSEWLAANSSRKLVALRLWALILSYVDKDTGEIALSRDEIAELLNVSVGDVSRVTSELVECRALWRRRVKVPGMRGAGVVRYGLNPLVGTHIGREAGKAARRLAERLDLSPPGERRSRSPGFEPVVL